MSSLIHYPPSPNPCVHNCILPHHLYILEDNKSRVSGGIQQRLHRPLSSRHSNAKEGKAYDWLKNSLVVKTFYLGLKTKSKTSTSKSQVKTKTFEP